MAGQEQLLTDVTIFDNLVTESQDDGHFVIKGVFGRVDYPTGNKRYYPKPIVQRELQKLQEKINEGMCYGEAEHPVDGKTLIQRISHRITKIGLTEDGYVAGEMIVLNTDLGRAIQEMLKSGGKVGISSRGFGSLSEDANGNYRVGDNYKLVTYDIVANPSTEGAYVTSYDVKRLIESLEEFGTAPRSGAEKTDMLIEDAAKSDDPVDKILNNEAIKAVVESLTEQKPLDMEQYIVPISKSMDMVLESQQTVSEQTHKIHELLQEDFSKLASYVQSHNNALATSLLQLVEELKSSNEEANKEKLKLFESNEVMAHKYDAMSNKIEQQIGLLNESIVAANEKNTKLLTENETLRAQIAKNGKLINKLEESLEQATASAINNGKKLLVERKLAGRPDRSTIEQKLGNLGKYESLESLNESLEALTAPQKEIKPKKIAFKENIPTVKPSIDDQRMQLLESKLESLMKMVNDIHDAQIVDDIPAPTRVSEKAINESMKGGSMDTINEAMGTSPRKTFNPDQLKDKNGWPSDLFQGMSPEAFRKYAGITK